MNEKLRKDALKIFEEAVRSVSPEDRVERCLNEIVDRGSEFFIVSIGKAAWKMAHSASSFLEREGLKYDGIVLTKYGHSFGKIRGLEIFEAGHPVPDENSVKATNEILRRVSNLRREDREVKILFLISGGGSALFESPMEPLKLEEIVKMNDLLLKCGATIGEINTVRKHLSKVKGGRFAEYVYPTRIITLILSDVLGDPPSVIASGPTVPDETTFLDVWRILEKYELLDDVPKTVLNYIEDGIKGLVPETPKELDNVEVRIIGNLKMACDTALKKAKELGYDSMVLTTFLEGEAKEAGRFISSIAKEITTFNRPLSRPCAVIFGGETTVKVEGKGKGGRNQELALSFALCIEGMGNVVLLSAGTDGTDGPTDAAGGLVDGGTAGRIRRKGHDPLAFLRNNDSYNALNMSGDLLITGPTGTNVNDLMVLLCG